ncbi:pentatricopeptide repeat-containing protein At5g16640, mitochondrial [Ziziphus jujuba]|uniref:Pentatricopeptide repeat-containing protein At5g16640, mitochondrial n=1 Tax=Ziziphus jujuba TaxID=326968 RepID=A0ABM3IB03_ZIZJJ|nr:pentatricopeptide repeat-containing protein At5g16640, mitochondrial [Ziziphus jujuba]
MIDGCFSGGRISGAIDCLEMEEKGYIPDSCTYNIMICELITNNQTSKAVELNKEMVEGCFSADLSTAAMFVDLISKVGRTEVARELFYKMQDDGQLPDLQTYGVLLDGLCKSKQLDEAMELFSEMEEKNWIYNILIGGLCKTGKLEAAKDIFYSLSCKG